MKLYANLNKFKSCVNVKTLEANGLLDLAIVHIERMMFEDIKP